MRALITLAFAVSLAGAGGSEAQRAQAVPPTGSGSPPKPAASACPSCAFSEDQTIRNLIQHYMDARNHMDEAALRNLFTPDADQLVSTGQWRHGLGDLLKGALASSKNENNHSSVTVESIRMLGHNAAIADGRYETTSRGDATPRKMWSTFILQRTRDGWKIAAIRNMLPSSP